MKHLTTPLSLLCLVCTFVTYISQSLLEPKEMAMRTMLGCDRNWGQRMAIEMLPHLNFNHSKHIFIQHFIQNMKYEYRLYLRVIDWGRGREGARGPQQGRGCHYQGRERKPLQVRLWILLCLGWKLNLFEAAEAPPWPQRSVYRLKDQLHYV